MHYVYSENTGGSFINPAVLLKMDANKKYAEHFYNHCYLSFILKHEASSFVEKQQANKEIAMASKKMEYWKRMPSWDPQISGKLCDKIRKDWSLDLNSSRKPA